MKQCRASGAKEYPLKIKEKSLKRLWSALAWFNLALAGFSTNKTSRYPLRAVPFLLDLMISLTASSMQPMISEIRKMSFSATM